MRDYLDTSEIKESGSDLTGMEMVSEILKDYGILLEYMFNVVDAALDNGDNGTVDMMNSLIKKTEKNHWMLTAFSKK